MSPRALLCLSVLLLAPWTASALAQADRVEELETENARLQNRIDGLMRELLKAKDEIARLERELRAARQGGSDEADELTIRVDPVAGKQNPMSLLAQMQSAYGQVMRDLKIGEPDTPTRRQYMRVLTQWSRQIARDLRARVEWPVIVTDAPEPRGAGYIMRVQYFDKDAKEYVGDPFPVLVSKPMMLRLRRLEARDEVADGLILTGIMSSRVNINPERTEVGAFDNPRFVGPFTEFAMSFSLQNVAPLVPKNLSLAEKMRVNREVRPDGDGTPMKGVRGTGNTGAGGTQGDDAPQTPPAKPDKESDEKPDKKPDKKPVK